MAIKKDGSLIGRPTKKQAAESEMRAKVEAQAAKEARDAAFERLKVETDITQQMKDRASSAAVGLNIEKSINNIQDSALGKILEKFNLEKAILAINEAKASGDKDLQASAEKYAATLAGVASGAMDASDVLAQLAKDGEDGQASFGPFAAAVEEMAGTMQDMPDLSEKLKVEADAQAKIDAFKKKITDMSAMLSSPKAMGVAAVGMLVKLMKDFAAKTLEVKQSLGTTGLESVRIAGNMTAAGTAAKVLGGSSREAEAAVKGMVEEFGTLNVVSLGTSISLGKMVADTGISGANAAKLLKSMESISTASIDTNIALISSTAELARAEGVAPAKVMNDIASSTETFAEFAKDGGANIAEAAIGAAKLGLSLSTVAKTAESLLNFENSIEKQMEAQMLIGRSLNLDKARELALAGKLGPLAEELKSQVGSQAEFEAMNVVQRKALADAMGLTVTDMGKMIAGEKTSAELAEETAKKKEASMSKQHGLELALGSATAAAAIAQATASVFGIFGSFAKIPFGIGIPLGIAAVASMFGLAKGASAAVGLEAGGEVKETGNAVVHRGEVFSGTNDEMGMSTRETNKILREMMAQNELLMRKLTGEVVDMKLA